MPNPKGNPENLKPFAPTEGKTFDGRADIRIYLEQEKKLKSIPGWTNKLRAKIDELIEEEGK